MNDSLFDTIFTVNPRINTAALNNGTCDNAKTAHTHTSGHMYEFHVSKEVRDRCNFDSALFATNGNVILANFKNVRLFAKKINDTIDSVLHPEQVIRAGELNAMGLIDEIFHHVCYLFRKQKNLKVFDQALSMLDSQFGKEKIDHMLLEFIYEFPPLDVYNERIYPETYLEGIDTQSGISNRITTLEELVLLHLANENPAFKPFTRLLFGDAKLQQNPLYAEAWTQIKDFFKTQPVFGPKNNDLITMLKEPVVFSPNSIKGQLDYIRLYWTGFMGDWLKRLFSGIDLISEENKPGWDGASTNLPPMEAYNYEYIQKEYERYSPDSDWMPRVVLMAKTVLVWLNQLSDKYSRPITRLDQIPDEEIDILAARGFTGLWLIGLWERSDASKRIKQINGNPEAAASAYSLNDYDIAHNLGGWEALDNFRARCWQRGIRLASDMVPNHTGMDAKWVVEKPDLFIQRRDCPFPTYTFNGENLSHDGRVSIYLEDHYYQKSDCAVVFKRVDNSTGDTRYIYHGNDGTGMPWNDTAQIDFLNPTAREEVIQKILHVARNFPIIRFDAAMVLAKKHIKRLWYPEPGRGGDIATRSESALSRDEFEDRIPNEFWREVVDRCAKEIPDTLLLAEAFWMMEGYFVRTLGMHRVYNSAFMNMLKKEENYKYRQTVKNTLEFDPQVLRRFVNFMNNPDEETAVAQFGKGDKYFGICTLMVTMPGLPMFGHGQIEGFTEKYGMEYQKAYWKETPDQNLIDRHNHDIFPLMKKRYLFAEVTDFYFYDVWSNGAVNENVFAYSNCFKDEKSIVLYNNVYQQATGWIKESCKYAVKDGEATHLETKNIADALAISKKDDTYCIFQEQRSGLWFIRTCSELHKNGLFLSLNGFESQVLLNFSEVTDDETGKYAILYKTLAGRGVQNIEIALQEIFLKDLYTALTDFATADLFETFAQILVPEVIKQKEGITVPTLDTLLKSYKKAGIHYFEVLAQFIEGNYGAAKVLAPKERGAKVTPLAAWKKFCAILQEIVAIKTSAEGKLPPLAQSTKSFAAPVPEKSPAEPSAAATKGNDKANTDKTADKAPVKTDAESIQKELIAFNKKLYDGILARRFMGEYLVAFAIQASSGAMLGKKATPLHAHALATEWSLNRKLFDVLKIASLTDTHPNRDAALLLTSLKCSGISFKDCQKGAAAVVTALFDSKDAALITGLNEYNGVRWFGKEQMEDALRLPFCAAVLQSGGVGAVTKKVAAHSEAKFHIAKAMEIAQKAASASEYKADDLIALLSPQKKKGASVKGTPTAQKAKAATKKAAANTTQKDVPRK